MIVWLNGPFGAGKTSTSRALLALEPSWSVVDTETLGCLLRPVLGMRRPVADFQDWPAWRRLCVALLSEVRAELATTVVVPQTLLVESYWSEITAGLAERGEQVRPFTLHVERSEHERRIARDWREFGARRWRRDRRADYDRALPWLAEATTILDTTEVTTSRVASRISELTHG